jgi:HEAT repeat protein
VTSISVRLGNDEVLAVRAEAARVLGGPGDPLAVDALAEALCPRGRGGGLLRRRRAGEDRWRPGAPCARAARARVGTLSEQAFFWIVQTLSRLGSPSLPALVELFASPSWTRRRVVAEAVAKIGRAAEGALVNSLGHENPDVRFWVCQSLGRVGSHEAVEKLRAHLEDPNKDVRFAAVTALGEIGSQAAIRYLKESLKSDRRDIRVRSLEILGRMGSDVVESLVDCLSDESWVVRDQAAKSAAKLGRDAVRPLLHAYDTGNEDIRINAVKAFCLVGEEAVDALLRALDDRFEPVALKAVEGLAALGPRVMPRLLEYFHAASVNGRRFARA